MKKIYLGLAVVLGAINCANAADNIHNLNFKDAVNNAVSSGELDNSVKFFLAGDGYTNGHILQKNVIANKKTNGFLKSADNSCDWVLKSALIDLQSRAKKLGGNAVVNIVSYYKSHETSNPTTYECHKGGIVAGVTLKGDIIKY